MIPANSLVALSSISRSCSPGPEPVIAKSDLNAIRRWVSRRRPRVREMPSMHSNVDRILLTRENLPAKTNLWHYVKFRRVSQRNSRIREHDASSDLEVRSGRALVLEIP